MTMMMNKQAAFSALNTYAAAIGTARTNLCAAMCNAGYETREDAAPIVQEWAVISCGASVDEYLKASKTGKVMLISTLPKSAAIRQAYKRAMDAFEAPEKDKTTVKHVEVPKALIKAMKEFIAEGWTKGELRAAIAAIK